MQTSKPRPTSLLPACRASNLCLCRFLKTDAFQIDSRLFCVCLLYSIGWIVLVAFRLLWFLCIFIGFESRHPVLYPIFLHLLLPAPVVDSTCIICAVFFCRPPLALTEGTSG